ncbi:DUF2339 domain-containing protein [Mesorhizobium sp. WSM2239]|uniref:DUF2339 domain-containing protein n=2 Tax=unclassified Mesorhizobium TaxID=325217 RepID=A0AAU8D4W1_9HYPH
MLFDSFGLLGTLGLVALVVIVIRLNTRLGLVERELGAMRSLVLSRPPAAAASAVAKEQAPPATMERAGEPIVDGAVPETAEQAGGEPAEPAGPWGMVEGRDTAGAEPAPAAAAGSSAAKADIETALGTRWAVWVGGVALALGGVFLIRYSIEAGIFGPGVRLTMAALLGLALVGAGEFIRRTGFEIPLNGGNNAYIPGILTAAGAFTLFGAVYAAHGVYGFIGPASAFVLMGIIGVGTVAAALVHGQALAGFGLLGSLVTPLLVASEAPNAWALFGYLAIVLAAAVAIARLRDWRFLAGAAFAGTGLWCLVYMAGSETIDFTVVLFINLVILLSLALIWLGRRGGGEEAAVAFDWPTAIPALSVAFAALSLLINPDYQALGGALYGTILITAMVAIALYRPGALALLHAAGAASVVAYARAALSGTFAFDFAGGSLVIDGFPATPFSALMPYIGAAIGALFLAAGLWSARNLAASAPVRGAHWAAWAALTPLAILMAVWIISGNPDRDYGLAAVALLLGAILTAGGEAIARAENPPLAGGLSVSFALVGAGVALVLFLHMAFGPGLTTVLVGAAAALPALATRQRSYPVLGWLSVGAAIVVMARVAVDPTIVGRELLGRTPVFNALLPGYGIPALAFGFAAWQLARTTAGRPRLAMEAAAALFSLLAAAMLVRHAMHGGVIDSSAPTLAEQAIYTLLALGAGAILIALDMRSPSPVLRYGSIAAGCVSAILIVANHFFTLNPLFTDESTGRIPFFNLLLLAYLLPAIAAGALALYARGKRPRWYPAMLALVGAALAFVYATLSVRRLFKGEFIGFWSGLGQFETYSYSALWLAMGVGLLVAGVWQKSYILRIASGALIAIAVAKVFLFDMSELEGVLRALSFIGLGAVLIGIGLFYQRLLTRAARTDAPAKAQ